MTAGSTVSGPVLSSRSSTSGGYPQCPFERRVGAVSASASPARHTGAWSSRSGGFYLRMGAERVGEREVAPGRVLPVLRGDVPEV
ncbi:hypothetical protein SLA_2129 [Streptomyces laurentii]|uniref:Uncharacterized protein n=1 Tax=Streptomyces laurentii TaxID=39478 RepID=A0A160NYS4_STRLU|nr:hypothetical protein SLA_2129 [Streptomyces laurentii]